MAKPRSLPHSTEAENAALGGIMLRGQDALAEVLGVINEADFYQPRTQAVFRAMRILDGRNEPIDVITLETQLRRTGELELVGGIEGLAMLDRHATANNILAHADIIRRSSQIRQLVVAGREIAEEGLGEIEDFDAYIDKAEQSVFAVRASARKGGPRHVRQGIGAVFQDITERQRQDSKVTGVATPWAALNEITSGFQPSDLIIIAARPSMGKTALCLNIAENAAISSRQHVIKIEAVASSDFGGNMQLAYEDLTAKNLIPRRTPTLFFSLEMGESQLIERVLCSESKVDSQSVRKGSRLMEHDFRSLIRAAERMTNHSDLYIDDQASLSITEFRSRARVWAAKHLKPVNPADPNGKQNGLIMIDYLQLARGGKPKYGSREQEISEISQGLKAMAKELKVPVIALSQLNRAVDSRADHRPQLADLRESGAIEQDADVIMFIYREERYLAADAPDDQRRMVENKAEIIIGKQRNGPVGTVNLTFEKKHTRFETPKDDGL